MVDSRDPEKYDFQDRDTFVPSRTSKSLEHEHSKASSIHSTASSASIHSDRSDPLAPLESALSHTADVRTEAERLGLANTRTGASARTTASRPVEFEVDFTDNDPDDPKNWPMWRRCATIGIVSLATWSVVLYSTSYTSSMPGMMKEFGIKSEPIATLGVTAYLVGLACGSLILAPLSEIYGRRPVYMGSMAFFCLMVLPCALATGLPEVIVVRFFG